METGDLNISQISFNFNELIELVKQLSDKEKKQLKAFLKKETIAKTNDQKKRNPPDGEKSKVTNDSSLSEGEDNKMLKVSDFSFIETQVLLKNCKTSFSDEVVAERREAI